MKRLLSAIMITGGTLSLLLLCTPGPVSGPSTEEGNPQVVAVVIDSLRWYEVERIDLEGSFDTTFTTTETFVVDTVNDIPSGTTLNYVVRSVDRAFNRSANAGPLEMGVE